jgi:hypothetical protein
VQTSQPRVYRLQPGKRRIAIGLGLTIAAASLVAATWICVASADVGTRGIYVLACLVAAGGAAYMVLAAMRTQISVWPDSVEITGALESRRVSRAQIIGRRSIEPDEGPAFVELETRHEYFQTLRIPGALQTDAHFDAWLAEIPDLDTQGHRQVRG